MMDITDSELAMVSSLAEKQVELEVRIAKGEALLEQLKKEHREISEKALPAALQEVGLASVTLTNGKKVTVKTEIYASIPKDSSAPAFAWLRDHGHGALIKNIISTEFGKGEDEKAVEAAMLLAEAGFTPSQKESVHPMTLKAFLKEQVEKGQDVPLDLFGAFVFNKSKVA